MLFPPPQLYAILLYYWITLPYRVCVCVRAFIYICIYIYIHMYINAYTHISLSLYIYIYIYVRFQTAVRRAAATRMTKHATHNPTSDSSHRWNRNPRPQPQKFSKLVFLIWCCSYCICLNWLSGAGVPISLVIILGMCMLMQQTCNRHVIMALAFGGPTDVSWLKT